MTTGGERVTLPRHKRRAKTAARTQSKEDTPWQRRTTPPNGLRQMRRAKSSTPVAEEVVLEDYVMLDFVEDFVRPGELHASVSDSD
jgi:hypothetical protein